MADTARRRLAATVAAAAAVAVTVVVAVWAAYGFRFSAAGSADPGGSFVHSWQSRLDGAGAAAPAISFLREQQWLPEGFLWGLAYTLATTGERDAFLNGEYSSTGWWYFFPYAFLVKTPLPFLALLLLAAIGRFRKPAGEKLPSSETGVALVVFFAVYLAVALTSSLNLGHRHLLPLYPMLFIFAGAAVRAPVKAWTGRIYGGVLVILLGLFVADSWHVRPRYLSYFNALAGGPENGYRHLVDSSLDWGQDLPALADYLRRHRGAEPVYVAYFGSADPAYYGIENVRWLQSYFPAGVPWPPVPLEPGTYCISATLLRTLHTGRPGPWTAQYEAEYQEHRREMEGFWQEGSEEPADLLARQRLFVEWNRLRSVRLFHALQERPPDARAGYSILIYRLSAEELRHASRQSSPSAISSN